MHHHDTDSLSFPVASVLQIVPSIAPFSPQHAASNPSRLLMRCLEEIPCRWMLPVCVMCLIKGALVIAIHLAMLHWHVLCGPTTEQSLEFSLTEECCRNHFLVGLLLREVAEALQQAPEIRQLAVGALKNLLIKHAMDDRYTVFKVKEGGAPNEEGNTSDSLKKSN